MPQPPSRASFPSLDVLFPEVEAIDKGGATYAYLAGPPQVGKSTLAAMLCRTALERRDRWLLFPNFLSPPERISYVFSDRARRDTMQWLDLYGLSERMRIHHLPNDTGWRNVLKARKKQPRPFRFITYLKELGLLDADMLFVDTAARVLFSRIHHEDILSEEIAELQYLLAEHCAGMRVVLLGYLTKIPKSPERQYHTLAEHIIGATSVRGCAGTTICLGPSGYGVDKSNGTNLLEVRSRTTEPHILTLSHTNEEWVAFDAAQVVLKPIEERILEAAKTNPEASQRELALIVGTSQARVSRALRMGES